MPGPNANKGGNKSGGRDTGKDTPSYKGASIKGLTSKDPGNVARNREGASRYASKSERMSASTRDTNVDKAATQAAARAARPATPAVAATPKKTTTPAAPKQRMMATKAPAGYRPGIDSEFNYRTGAGGTPTAARVTPTVGLAARGMPGRGKGGPARGTPVGTPASGSGAPGTPLLRSTSGLASMMAKGGKTKPKGKKK